MERISSMLEHVWADARPKPGWETRVLAAGAPAPPSRRRRTWPWLGAIASAAVAVAVGLALTRPSKPTDARSTLLLLTTPSPGVRGSGSAPGTLVAVAVGGGPYRGLRIYRHDALVQSCPGDDGCTASTEGLLAVRELGVGDYAIVYAAGHRPLPPSSGHLGEDLRALQMVDAAVQIETRRVR